MVRCRFCSISSVDRPDGYFKVDGKWVLVKWETGVCPKCQYMLDMRIDMIQPLFNYQEFRLQRNLEQSKLFGRIIAEYGATMGKITK